MNHVWYPIDHTYSQGINESANFGFLQRLSVIFGFRRDCQWSLASCRDYHPRKMASCRDCLCESASCRDSRQEARSHGQSLHESLQEAIYQAQKSWQEAWDRWQSRQKPNMTDSLCRKRKLADSFIPCDIGYYMYEPKILGTILLVVSALAYQHHGHWIIVCTMSSSKSS